MFQPVDPLDEVLSVTITVCSTLYYRAGINCTHTCRVASGGIYLSTTSLFTSSPAQGTREDVITRRLLKGQCREVLCQCSNKLAEN